jgi:predicted PurR-regulated permease PerM
VSHAPTEIDAEELTGVLSTPGWLRELGRTSWLLVGVTLLVVAAVWIMSLTQTIVAPLITAAVVAAVAAPLIAWAERHRVPRLIGAVLLLVGFIALSVGMVLVVIGGITSQSGDLSAHLADAKDTIAGWLKDLGVDPSTAESAKSDASSAESGLKTFSSVVFFLALTALSLVFLLKDGPQIRAWAERHAGLPLPLTEDISGRSLESLRGYFFGVTLVAVFNTVLVTLGALVLGVPLVGTIAAVTFLGAYVPYLGAWTAGAFSVLVALGGAGTDAAVGMIVVQLLANGVLQQMVQPVAYGAALGIHPLAVLIVTIAGGSLFGAAGLILAAPVTSAAVRVSADLARARETKPVEDVAAAHTAAE